VNSRDRAQLGAGFLQSKTTVAATVAVKAGLTVTADG
jgi:hypothetical protein